MRKLVMIAIILSAFGFAYYKYQKTPLTISTADYEKQFNAASQLLLANENERAIEIFEALAASNDQFPAVFFNLGRAYSNIKEWDKAFIAFDRALKFSINFTHLVHFHKGMAAFNKEDWQLAEECFKAACALKADYVESLYYLGMIAQKQSKLELAAEYLTHATQLNPSFSTCLLSVAHDLRNEEKLSQAYACCKSALEMSPQDSKAYYAHLMMGDIDNMQGRPEDAIFHYQTACDANAECHEAFNNLGALYAGQYGDLQKAKPYLEKALSIKPNHAGTQAGLSALYLVQGDFERGWQAYEHRLERFFETNPRTFEKPRWDGQTSLKGKKIVIHAEQGLGDTLQFIRYAQMMKQKGAEKIIAEVQKPLCKLFALCPYIDLLVIPGEAWPEHDLHVELMSLPYFCKTRVASIPASIPYLYPDTDYVKEWNQKMAADKNFKIGICWHVEPSHDADMFRGEGKTISISGCKRSVPLELLVPFAKQKGISVYSLQKHNGLEELAALNKDRLIQDFGGNFDTTHGSFMDTAAIMKNLDLVITADTSIAHLAGALGVPVWVMLPFPADWRWLTDRTDTPWYPSMRLFRKQRNDKGWIQVMAEINKQLIKMVT